MLHVRVEILVGVLLHDEGQNLVALRQATHHRLVLHLKKIILTIAHLRLMAGRKEGRLVTGKVMLFLRTVGGLEEHHLTVQEHREPAATDALRHLLLDQPVGH